jgi:predicted RND superfamily exporter protein
MHRLFPYKNYLIALFGVLILLSGFAVTRLDFYYDLEDFFPKDEAELQFLRKYQSALESDDTYIFLAIDNHKSIFDTAFLQRLQNFTTEARSLESVVQANSLATIYDYIKTPIGFSRIPLLHVSDYERIKQDSARILQDIRWRDNFISNDATITVVFLKSIPHIPQKRAEKLVKDLDSLLLKYNFKDTHVVSRAHTQNTFISLIKEEVGIYIILSIAVLFLIMALVFRRFWGVVVPVCSSVTGLILFLGYMGATGQPLDLMSVLFPVLILTIGMSDIIHLMNKYIEEERHAYSREMAMQVAIKEIGFATLLTCVTTIIGFIAASLTTSIRPIQLFSLNAAVGVLIAYLTAIFFTCMLLLYFKGDKLALPRLQTNFWDKLVKRIYFLGLHFPRRVFIICLVVLLASIVGINRVSTNTNLLSDIPRKDKLRQDFVFFEEELSGARPFEMAVLPQNGNKITDLKVLRQTEKLENYLRNRGELGNIATSPDIYKSMHKAFHGGTMSQFLLPQSQAEIDKYNTYLAETNGDVLHALINPDQNIGRISGRIKDLGSEKIKAVNEEISGWINKNIDTSIVNFHHTGLAIIIDKNNELLRVNLFQGLGLAFLLIAAVMAFLFRDAKMVVISLIPNIFPLIICGGIMGWLGIELKASTAIIFEVVFGIAVDDTIHFLTQYKLELTKGRTPQEAVYYTFIETGKAIILTSLVLFSGFFILIFSTFTATYYIGILMSFTFLSALLSELFLLPLILRWVYRN